MAVAQLVTQLTSLVISRLDYCNNSALAGLPAWGIASLQLQRVQNSAARLVLNRDRLSHISPALHGSYWLPVKYCIIFKIATTFYIIDVRRISSTWLHSTRQTVNTSKTLASAVVKAPKSSHISITPTLKSLHWLKVNESNIRFFSLSHIQDSLYCSTCISPQPDLCMFSLLVALDRHLSSPSLLVHPHLPLTNRSFRPASFRQPRSSPVTTITPSITSSLLHSRLKTHLFHTSLSSHHRSSPRLLPTGLQPDCLTTLRYVLVLPLSSFS